MPLFGAAYAAPNKGITILYGFSSPKTVLNHHVNGKIQGLFKAFECFSSTFQGKFNFQGLFKTVLYIQVLFKSVLTLCHLLRHLLIELITKIWLNTAEKYNVFEILDHLPYKKEQLSITHQ